MMFLCGSQVKISYRVNINTVSNNHTHTQTNANWKINLPTFGGKGGGTFAFMVEL